MPSKPISSLVYVHGTNGSGKSTLARALGAAAGGFTGYTMTSKKPDKCGYTETPAGLVLIGKYGTACGGVDGVHPYALVVPEMEHHAAAEGVNGVFAEGLITPGVETCQRMAAAFEQAIFVHLATPVEDCIAHVLARRKRTGNVKPYDPANLHKKATSAAHWADRLERNGLDVRRLNYREAYGLCLLAFNLPEPTVNDLL